MKRSALIVALCYAVPGAADAQRILSLGAPKGELGFEVESDWRAGRSRLTREEWFRLSLSGAVLDPGLLHLDFSVRPRLAQTSLQDGRVEGRTDSRILGFDLGAALFRRLPVNASFRVFRQTTTLEAPEGDTYGRRSGRQLRIQYRNRWMPLRLMYRNESWDRRVGFGNDELLANRDLESVRLSGRNRKTTFVAERRLNRAPVHFVERRVDFQNQQQWGKGSQLQIALGYWDRSGELVADVDGVTSGVNLHLQHLTSLWSDWSVRRFGGETDGAENFRNEAEASLTWQFLQQTSIAVRSRNSNIKRQGLEERRLQVEPVLESDFELGPLSISTTASVGYERFSSNRADQEQVRVVNEVHRADESGAFLLNNPDVDPSSVIVTDQEGGVLSEGLDYELVELGGFTEVVSLPGGRLTEGSQVRVDYLFQPPPEFEANSLIAGYGTTVRFRWFRLFYRRWLNDPRGQLEQESQLGGLRYLEDERLGGDVRFGGGTATAVLRFEWLERIDDGYRLTSSTVGGSLRWRPSRVFGANIGGDYRHSSSTTGSLDRVSGRSGVEAWISPELLITGAVSWWRSVQRSTQRSVVLGTRLQISWRPGLANVNAYYLFRDWSDDPLGTETVRELTNHRVVMEIRRRF